MLQNVLDPVRPEDRSTLEPCLSLASVARRFLGAGLFQTQVQDQHVSAAPFWFPTRFTFWHTLQWRASSFVHCRVTGPRRAHKRKKKRDSDTGVAREAEITRSENVNNRRDKRGLKDCILLWCSRRLWSSVESTRARKRRSRQVRTRPLSGNSPRSLAFTQRIHWCITGSLTASASMTCLGENVVEEAQESLLAS